MIKAIINGIFNLVLGLVDIVLMPIDLIIQQFLPGVSDVISSIGAFFNYILGVIPFLCSWFHIPPYLILFLISYWTFRLTVPLLVHAIKNAVAWYNKLKV